jgi:hypothetical protein
MRHMHSSIVYVPSRPAEVPATAGRLASGPPAQAVGRDRRRPLPELRPASPRHTSVRLRRPQRSSGSSSTTAELRRRAQGRLDHGRRPRGRPTGSTAPAGRGGGRWRASATAGDREAADHGRTPQSRYCKPAENTHINNSLDRARRSTVTGAVTGNSLQHPLQSAAVTGNSLAAAVDTSISIEPTRRASRLLRS